METGNAGQGQQLTGVVTVVNPRQLTVTTDDGQQRTLHTDAKTVILLQGQPVRDASQIPEGSQVRASFSGQGNQDHPMRIEVIQGGPQGAPSGNMGSPGNTGSGSPGAGSSGNSGSQPQQGGSNE